MMLGPLGTFFGSWLDALAAAGAAVSDRLSGQDAQLQAVSEGDTWQFVGLAGEPIARIEPDGAIDSALAQRLRDRNIEALLPENLIFRSELPPVPPESRDVLAAIVEHRVDRISPWRQMDRLTGFSTHARDDGQIGVDAAVTARTFVAPVIAAATAAGARRLSISAAGASGDDITIDVELPGAHRRIARLRRGIGLAVIVFAALVAVWAGLLGWRSYDLAQQSAELQDSIDQRMATIRRAAAAAEKTPEAVADPLERAKNSGPVAVVVIEALSRLLPDDTWLSSLRLEGAKVRIAGTTRSLSSLVPKLVSSGYFSDAGFAEPTERQADGSDLFSIELTIKPAQQMEAL